MRYIFQTLKLYVRKNYQMSQDNFDINLTVSYDAFLLKILKLKNKNYENILEQQIVKTFDF